MIIFQFDGINGHEARFNLQACESSIFPLGLDV